MRALFNSGLCLLGPMLMLVLAVLASRASQAAEAYDITCRFIADTFHKATQTAIDLRALLSAMVWRFFGAVVIAFLAGCSTVTVHNGTVEQTKHFGVVNVSVKPDIAAATVVATRSLGLAIGTRTGALGYLDEVAFIAPDASKCRLMIVIRDLSEIKDLEAQLSGHPSMASLCFITPMGGKS